MNSKLKSLFSILFYAVYLFACLLTSRNNDTSIFGFNSFSFQAIKTLLCFIIIYALTLLNKNNIEKITSYCTYCTMLIGVIYMIDCYFFQISGAFYSRLWWLCHIHISYFAVYFGVLSLKGIDFKAISHKLTEGYAVLYFASFAIAFLRPAGNTVSMNKELGNGTFGLLRYLMSNFTDWEIWLIVLGNVIFFIPLVFILKTIIPKIKDYHIIIIGIIIPVFVEGYQLLLKCGDVDIDDIIMNFSGFLIGLLLFKIQDKIKEVS